MSGRAFVTGAEGFVGGHLRRHLLARGWEVTGTRRPTVAAPTDLIPCDVADAGSVDRALAAAGAVTHVFHLAGVAFAPDAAREPAEAYHVNLLGTVNVVAALLRRRPGARLVYVGSADAYGRPGRLPVTEEAPLAPEHPYAISKAAAEQHCAWAGSALGLDVVRLRPFNHSGAGQSEAFVLPAFARQLARIEAGLAEPRLMVGDLSAKRDFSHVLDVVDAYERAALHGAAGEAYNVCSGRSVAVREALERLRAMANRAVSVEVDPARLRAVDVPEMLGSHAKLTAKTGWRPTRSFEALLAELLVDWRARASGCAPGPSGPACRRG